MENIYSAYVRTVNGNPYFFVKKFQVFPEYKDLPPILDTYGMHTDFAKACKIAMISDKLIQQQLINELPANYAPVRAKKAQSAKAKIYNLRPRQINFPSIFKLDWLTKIS